jgi:hypothetical protein
MYFVFLQSQTLSLYNPLWRFAPQRIAGSGFEIGIFVVLNIVNNFVFYIIILSDFINYLYAPLGKHAAWVEVASVVK